MPTYTSYELPINEPKKLKIKTKPCGFRKILRIPYLYDFPYFSGSVPRLKIEITNYTPEVKTIKCSGRLYLLFHRPTQERFEDEKDRVHRFMTIEPNRKCEVELKFARLAQPGNYSIKLEYAGDIPYGHGDNTVYFDALPKDGSTLNISVILIGALIGFILGLISGWLING